MVIDGISDKGLTRKNNQDNYLIETIDDYTLAVVCDGIGGHKGGEIASSLTCKIMKEEFKPPFENVADWLGLTCKVANRNVFLQGSLNETTQGMGTTMVALVVQNKKTTIVNIGDSRCYVYKNGELKQITVDHSLVNELLDNGFTYQEAISHGKNVITRAIGIESNCQYDIYELDNDYEALLLCTDGLYNYVSKDKIIAVLKEKKNIHKKTTELVALANQAGGYDNITVVLLEE